ncbi:MAG: hypothetical protein KDA21_04480 [Phycisphaerales bacterium]|nr:hypothetical protein [Phycisphaerales bacterium]
MLLMHTLYRLSRLRCAGLAGLLVGAAALPATVNAAMLREGFSGTTVSRGWQNVPDVWGGDLAISTGETLGVAPMRGDSMLQFLSSGGSLTSSSLSSSDIYRTIDLTGMIDQVTEGNVLVRASYYVNRVGGDAQTDSRFGIGIHAYAGDTGSFSRQVNNPLDLRRESILSDADTSTWQRVTVDLVLPTNTTFVAIWIGAQENVFNDTGGAGPEFDGHFADDVLVRVRQVPAPAGAGIMLLGGLTLLRRRR